MSKELRCTDCGEIKSATKKFFPVAKTNKSGFAGRCRECQNRLARERYANDNEHRKYRLKELSKYRDENKEDILKRARERYKRPDEHWKRIASRLKTVFGLTAQEFCDMLDAQMGVCGICGNPLYSYDNDKRPSVDHCHDTGKVRGLLCKNCNSGIGMMQDNPDIVYKAYQYLTKC